MRGLFISALAAAYLYGAAEPNAILGEVAKLRQKYEECRQGQSAVIGTDPKVYQECENDRRDAAGKLKGYQARIANLETQSKENNALLTRLQNENRDMARTLSQKEGVVKSLEQTLTARDQKYREAVALNEQLSTSSNVAKVSKIERESLKSALVNAKEENERLNKELKKIVSATPGSDANAKLQAMQNELSKAQSTIARLQNAAAVPAAVPEKVVYKDRPVIQEKIVTKVVEPTEKVKALQDELARAQATIANLKNAPGAKVVYQDRIVTQEKVVYKDRPVIQEKIVTKVVEPTEKLKALQTELVQAQATIESLKNAPAKVVVKEKIVPQEKIVYQDRIVTQEKVVYKDRPVMQEEIVTKVAEPTEKLQALQAKLDQTTHELAAAQAKKSAVADDAARRQIDKLALELERQKSLHPKLSTEPIKAPALTADPAVRGTKITAKSVAVPENIRPASNPMLAKPASSENVKVAAAGTPKKEGASAYRMASNAPIFTAPGGTQIDTWEARRSFTAGVPSGGWVHITGYFVNRVWQPTREDENLWVKESDVIRR